jgi:hypothetical protein
VLQQVRSQTAEPTGDQVGRIGPAGADRNIGRRAGIGYEARRIAHAHPVADLVLAVGLRHLGEQGRHAVVDRRDGIEIDEPSPELTMLRRKSAAEAP